MLKITISASLLKTVSSSLMAISSEAAIQQKEHPFIISQEKKSLERRAKMWEKSVEEIIKEDEELKAKYPSKSFIEKLPLISNIKAYTDKVFKLDVDAASKELTIEINEDFIAEAIKIGTSVVISAMEPALNLAAVFVNYSEEVDALQAKWNPEEEPTETTSAEVPASQVPEEIRKKVNTNDWVLVLDEHPSKAVPFFTDEEKENYIMCEDLLCTRGDQKFNCFPSTVQYILGSKGKTVEQLAERNKIPASLVRAIYAHYGVEAPAPKEEVKTDNQSQPAFSVVSEAANNSTVLVAENTPE